MPVVAATGMVDVRTGIAAPGYQSGKESFALLAATLPTCIGRVLENVPEGKVVFYHLDNHIPIRKPSEVGIVNEQVCLDLPGSPVRPVPVRKIAVDSVELESPLGAELYRFSKLLTLAHRPQDQLVTGRQTLERSDRSGTFRPYLRETMFDDGSVKVNCDYHKLNYASFSSPAP